MIITHIRLEQFHSSIFSLLEISEVKVDRSDLNAKFKSIQ